MRLAVTGGRDYWDVDTIFHVLDTWHQYRPISVLIHGACPTGLDHVADFWTASRGVECVREPCTAEEWDIYSKSAGPKRNQRIWDKHSPDALLSFPGNNGTANMIKCGFRAQKPVYAVSLIRHRIYRMSPDPTQHSTYTGA